MATFDQRGQHVTYRSTPTGDINIGAVQSKAELAAELQKLGSEVDKAAASGALDESVSIDTKYQIEKAAQQAKKAAPDKGALVGHLESAKDLIQEVGAAAGLLGGLVQAIEKVRVLF